MPLNSDIVLPDDDKPTTLIDLIAQIDYFMDRAGFPRPMVGKAYRDMKPGGAPHVIILPESGDGKIGGPVPMGEAGSVFHTCTIIIRAREGGKGPSDDLNRFREAYETLWFLVDCVATGGSARITWGGLDDGSPTEVNAFGAELQFAFVFEGRLPHHPKRWPIAKLGTLHSIDVSVSNDLKRSGADAPDCT